MRARLLVASACVIASACAAGAIPPADPAEAQETRSPTRADRASLTSRGDSPSARSTPDADRRDSESDEGSAASARRSDDEPTRHEIEERGAAAVAAYLATQEAFNRGDADAYAQGYAPVMSCWYGRTLQRFRRRPVSPARVQVHRVEIVSATAGEVLLADFGAFAPSSYYRLTAHRKLIQMHRTEGEWTIVGETSLANPGCISAPRSVTDPPAFSECLRRQEECLRVLYLDYPPHEDGTSGEDLRTQMCNCPAWECLGGRAADIGCVLEP